MPQLNQCGLEKRIKPILDRIHLARDLLNRLEYDATHQPVSTALPPDLEKEVPQLTDLPVDPDCLRKNLIPIICLIGGPGAGKGAQSRYIIEKYKFTYVNVGDVIREEIEKESPIGLFLAPTVDAGNLIRTDIIMLILKKVMLENFLTSRGYLIDGFPRTREQALRFEEEIARAHLIISLEVADDTMKMRMPSRGRPDDREETIKNKIKAFREESAPLINEFGKRCKTVSGEAGPPAVWLRVDEKIARMLVDWAFADEDLSGDGVDGSNFSASFPTSIQIDRKSPAPIMAEILGGVIPYSVQKSCTRKPLPFAGQRGYEEEEKRG